MYLPENDCDRLWAQIADLSAADSQLGVEYSTRQMLDTPLTQQSMLAADSDDVLHALADLWLNECELPPGEWLASHGWQAQICEIPELARRFDRPVPAAYDPTVQGHARVELIAATRK